jgi:hypothetical protein
VAITGYRTAAMVTRYTKRADQKRRAVAAIEKWGNAGENVGAKKPTRVIMWQIGERRRGGKWQPTLKSHEKTAGSHFRRDCADIVKRSIATRCMGESPCHGHFCS